MSRCVPYRSIRRPTNGEPNATTRPAGSRASAIFSGDQCRRSCRYSVIMNWKLR